MSVLLSLEEPTAKMRTEAASAGFYASAWGKHPRLQIVTVGELLAGVPDTTLQNGIANHLDSAIPFRNA